MDILGDLGFTLGGDTPSAGGGGFTPSFPSGLSLGETSPFANMQLPTLGAESITAPSGVFRGVAPTGPVDTETPGGGGTSLKDILGGVGTVARTAMPFAQLGLAGLNVKSGLDAAKLSREQAGRQKAFQEQQMKSAQPLSTFGQQTLQQAQAGHVDPSVQAMIDQWAQGEKVKIQQWFAHNGITNSTMLESALAQIDQQAVSMRADVLGKDKATAIQALQAAMQGSAQGAEGAGREQSQLDSLIAASNKALAELSGSM